MSRRLEVGSAILILAVVAGLVVGRAGASATGVSVSIPNGAGEGQSGAPGYSPATVTVTIGVNNTVTWTNNDAAAHTVTSTSIPNGASAFDSGIFSPGATFTQTFTVPGTYEYDCTLHSWMSGTVVVKASASPTPEFPSSYLAMTLFAVIAAVILFAKVGGSSRSAVPSHDRWR